MQSLKNYFKENEWKLVIDILENGKNESWLEIAEKFQIRPEGDDDQRRKAANDVWRKYQRKSEESSKSPKILIYDIETSQLEADVWWSGKQYVSANRIKSEPRIITVAYKWLGSDIVEYLQWDENQSDEQLVREFVEIYNEADMVVGYNSSKFDNRFLNARAFKYNLDINIHVKSLDLMREAKKYFRMPSYSLNNISRFLDLPTKLQHSGIDMWDAIQYGSKDEATQAMNLMIEYNIQDIIVTENLYHRMIKYIKSPIHVGVLRGGAKSTCPICGGTNVKLHKTTWTSAGVIQHIMRCEDDGHTFKISNSEYLKTQNNE